jgi:hypothetical protein
MPQIHQELERLVKEWFSRKRLPLALLDERRCLICSAEEFDRLAQIIGALGVDAVMSRLTEADAPTRVAAGMETRFGTELASVTDLFPEELQRLGPSLDPEATAVARV